MNKLTEQQLMDTPGRALYSFFDHQGKRREKPLIIQPDRLRLEQAKENIEEVFYLLWYIDKHYHIPEAELKARIETALRKFYNP